jgi:hypothetical protein
MLRSLIPLILPSVAIAGLFGPIATDNPAGGIAGGTVECGSPPVSSFFAGLNPPVYYKLCLRDQDVSRLRLGVVRNQWMVGPLCCSSGRRNCRWPLPV